MVSVQVLPQFGQGQRQVASCKAQPEVLSKLGIIASARQQEHALRENKILTEPFNEGRLASATKQSIIAWVLLSLLLSSQIVL